MSKFYFKKVQVCFQITSIVERFFLVINTLILREQLYFILEIHCNGLTLLQKHSQKLKKKIIKNFIHLLAI